MSENRKGGEAHDMRKALADDAPLAPIADIADAPTDAGAPLYDVDVDDVEAAAPAVPVPVFFSRFACAGVFLSRPCVPKCVPR